MSNNTFVSAPEQNKVKPKFVVHKLEGKRTKTMYEFDNKGKKKEKQVEVDAGYMVYFPHKGHSIRVETEADLHRLGFDQTVPLVDNNGEEVGYTDNDILDTDAA